MLRQNQIGIVFLGITLGLCTFVYGFGNKATHPALTEKAINISVIDDYLKIQLGFTEGIQTTLEWDFSSYLNVKKRLKSGGAEPEKTTRTILEWIKTGSNIEDEDGRTILPSIRPRHHFHDPIRNAGLDNKTDHPIGSWGFRLFSGKFPKEFDATGQSALVWSIEGTSQTAEPFYNYYTWEKARLDFYYALKAPSQDGRGDWMALVLLELGHVIHLIEDMGVPAHTRNDFIFGHLQPEWPGKIGNPFEGWVEKRVEQNGGQSPWSGSSAVAFDKLAKYFDANEYDGDYLEGGLPPETWGLSECTNYQFLSTSTMFGCSGTKYQFPHPDKENTEPNLLAHVADGNKIYFNGSNYGVSHIARESYTHYKTSKLWGYTHIKIDNTNTTDDVLVFEDYANITVPRTINYATGLINYFFRGRLSVEPNWADPNVAELVITNDSNNSGVPQVLKGGSFELYWDDGDGNRAVVDDFAVSGWGTESILDYNDTVTAIFTKETNAAAYTLVYQGQICESSSESDPCDPNAIAVVVFRPGYGIIAWGRDNEGQVSGVPDGNEFVAVAAGKWHCIALRSDGSLVGWGKNHKGQCNVPAGNDYVDISAGDLHSMALKSDGSIVVWGGDDQNQITDKPDGNDFVAITAGMLHSLAIKEDGTIVGWGGYNTYGECDAPLPDAGTIYIDIAAGAYHSLALQSDGVVKAWGNNSQGQTRIYEGAAGKVHDGVAAGGTYSFLLRDDNLLISWGGGDWESPGIPRYHYRQADGNDFAVIAAGIDHIMALTYDGKAFDWDWPEGDYPFDYFDRPVLSDVFFIEEIDGGYDFSVSLRLP